MFSSPPLPNMVTCCALLMCYSHLSVMGGQERMDLFSVVGCVGWWCSPAREEFVIALVPILKILYENLSTMIAYVHC